MPVPFLLQSRNRTRLRLAGALTRLLRPFYRLTFLAAASRSGLLKRLAMDRVPFGTLAAEWTDDPVAREAFRAWLDAGVALGVLGYDVGGYTLESGLALKFADVTFDAFAALIEEAVTLHHQLLLNTPERIQQGRLWSLEDHDASLVARSSRVPETLIVKNVVDRVPSSGSFRLLEVGCGSGVYIRAVLDHNREASAVGVERRPEVAAQARRNLANWGLADRTSILEADIRDIEVKREYDLVTLYNNIYYFPVEDRVGLFRHLLGFLKPRGRILVITSCLSKVPEGAVLNLWAASTRCCGRLPAVPELLRMLEEAGFTMARAEHLFPGTPLYMLEAARGG